MRKLSLRACGDAKVRHPFAAVVHGQPAQYVGWVSTPNGLAPRKEPEVITDDGSMKFENFLREIRRDRCLEPADADTAELCGVPFTKKGDK